MRYVDCFGTVLEVSSRWTEALQAVAVRLNRAQIDWMLVGSAATAIRDVPIEPGDLDIAMPTSAAVYAAARHLPSRPDRPGLSDPDDWYSTAAQPVRTFIDHVDSRWTFGRWTLCDTKVELAHIERPGATNLLGETFGVTVWAARTVVRWKSVLIPVVPLETQLVTMMLRQQHQRLEATLSAVGPDSIDLQTLRRAINDRRTDGAQFDIPNPVRRLLANGPPQ
jgi:hypothetical protein